MKQIGQVRIILVAAVIFLFAGNAFADGAMDRGKMFFMQKQYLQAIEEFSSVIRNNPSNLDLLSEANYFTGASYANLFDFLTAKKNFKVIVEKYKNTAYYEDAYLGLGDVELLSENLYPALKLYTEFYITNPSRKRRSTLYFRLSEVNLKIGDKAEYKKYFDKLQTEFPLSFEARDARRLSTVEDFYTLQVGAFTNYANAEKCIADLKARGYEVYSVVCMLSGKKLCRIRVGKCRTVKEAEELKDKLEKDGFSAKMFPQK